MNNLLQVVGEAADFDSGSLQTIDQLDVPRSGFQVGRYLVCGGEYIPGTYQSSSEPCDISLGRGLLPSDGFNRQLQLSVKADGPKMRIRWHATFTNRLRGASVAQRLEDLHNESTKMFEAMITDETRQFMEGEA
jgi:hypothetical protein